MKELTNVSNECGNQMSPKGITNYICPHMKDLLIWTDSNYKVLNFKLTEHLTTGCIKIRILHPKLWSRKGIKIPSTYCNFPFQYFNFSFHLFIFSFHHLQSFIVNNFKCFHRQFCFIA